MSVTRCHHAGLLLTLPFLLILATAADAVNPCCSYPCQNGGVCMAHADDTYTCDCSGLSYGGQNCHEPFFLQRIKDMLSPSKETRHIMYVSAPWLWDIVNALPFLREFFMKLVILIRSDIVDAPPTYTSGHEYITFEAASNLSYYTRALPPVPRECPTPLGVVGPKVLPDPAVIAEKIFRRRKFKPDAMGSNLLLTFFAQHFTHMFFKTDNKKGPGFTWSGHGVDMTHLYGPDKHTENLLRTFRDGKLKSQIINGEEWPPYVLDAPVKMLYPPSVPKSKQFALGHEFFGLLPGLLAYGTIWLREHNRVVRILKTEHPHWSDEQLFQTARLILIGETIKIVIEDYVQHLSNYNFKLFFKPELMFGESFQYSNRISVEFNHLYHWHPLMPDDFNISGTVYDVKKFLFNTEIPVKHGMHQLVDSFAKQQAGEVTSRNHGLSTLHVAVDTIKHGRTLRYQSFNQYRKRFDLEPYKSFQDLTGETEIASELEQLYGEVDAVEFYVGMMVEKHRTATMFGGSMIDIGATFSVKGLMANPICSPKYWRPSTFGGDVGFNIIKTASLKKLFCENMEGECPYVSFKVPEVAMTTNTAKNCDSNSSNDEL